MLDSASVFEGEQDVDAGEPERAESMDVDLSSEIIVELKK